MYRLLGQWDEQRGEGAWRAQAFLVECHTLQKPGMINGRRFHWLPHSNHQAGVKSGPSRDPEPEMSNSCWKPRLLAPSTPVAALPSKTKCSRSLLFYLFKESHAGVRVVLKLVVFRNSKNDNKCFLFYFISFPNHMDLPAPCITACLF